MESAQIAFPPVFLMLSLLLSLYYPLGAMYSGKRIKGGYLK